jgi:hypothetical protein
MLSPRQLVFFLLLTLLCPASRVGGGPELPGQIKGTIVLVNRDLRLPNVELTFEHGDQVFAASTDSSGSYSIALPSGTYTVKVYRAGLCRMRREAFVVEPEQVIRIDFELMICSSDVPGKYRYVALDAVPNTSIHPLVLFGESTKSGDATLYSGPVLPFVDVTDISGYPAQRSGHTTVEERRYPVVFSYNVLTIRCSELSYKKESREVIGTGEVKVQDGKTTSTGAMVKIVLNGLNPTIQVAP